MSETKFGVMKMTEEQERRAGLKLAQALYLRRDPQHKDRWKTAWGSKTDLGLWRTVSAQMMEMVSEAFSTTTKGENNK